MAATAISPTRSSYQLSSLQQLESDSIYIIREAAANFSNLGLLFSGGKDSIALLRLAQKAFWPARPPLSLVHVDTGYNFPEVLKAVDDAAASFHVPLIRVKMEDEIQAGNLAIRLGDLQARFAAQGQVLNRLIEEKKFDGLLGGARRDEDGARAKERIFSVRNEFGIWDPKNQRPEVWNLFNTRLQANEHQRVFPISDWTEKDVWNFIEKEKLILPSIYFAHRRSVVARGDVLYDLETGVVQLGIGEQARSLMVRVRTAGDIPTSGFVISEADSTQGIIEELSTTTKSERASRSSDAKQAKNLEDLKVNGHF